MCLTAQNTPLIVQSLFLSVSGFFIMNMGQKINRATNTHTRCKVYMGAYDHNQMQYIELYMINIYCRYHSIVIKHVCKGVINLHI